MENKVVEIAETEIVSTEQKEKKPLPKPINWLKKHGKTIAKGALVAAVGLAGYALGKCSFGNEDEHDEDDADNIEVSYSVEDDN